MNNTIKYRVHEVAKDFGLNSKDVASILQKYSTAPKNHMQALTDEELDIVFEVLTQTHQISDLSVVFAAADAEREKKKQETAAKVEKAMPKKEAKPEKAPVKKVERTIKVVDTRTTQVDLSKYDDKIDDLVPDRAQNYTSNKQKIKKVSDKKNAQQFSQKRKQEEQEKLRRLQIEALRKLPVKVMIPDEIAVGELAVRMKKSGADVVKQLMKLGVMASLSQVIDYDTAALVAMEMGAKVEKEVVVTIEEKLIDDSADKEENLYPRDPVVVVMGHVDHGKTSLLDAIRHTNVTAGEAGGITQAIGAYRVSVGDRKLTFLDTPGHAAFTAMRARGASATDVAILVVAADDGIMPQTVEAINHAKAAEIPIVVAVNKMDKPSANPDKIKQQLTEYSLVPEEWGGDTLIYPISALTKMGIEDLLEGVLLTADIRELKANPDRAAKGVVIEARLDKGRGPIATVLVQNGTLRMGDIIIAGKTVGRVRAMVNDKGQKVKEAGPSEPVEIIGLSEVPEAGDTFNAVADEKMARELVEERKFKEKNEQNKNQHKVTLEDLFSKIQEGQIKDLNIIVKADVQGSVEAVKASLEKITNEEVRVRVIHAAVGAINESDVILASTTGAIIVGFNVRPMTGAAELAQRNSVDMRMYRIIYDCINEIEAAMKGMLAPKYREAIIGHAEVRQTYKVSDIGTIAGSYVTDGKIVRNSQVRVVRDGIVIHEGVLASLKRFKDDAKEVQSGYECGMSVEKFNDIKEGDVIEAFVMEEIKQ